MITKGQKVWVVTYHHRNNVPSIEETLVKSVGRKYFTIEGDKYSKFHLDTMRIVTNYSPSTYVYTDIQVFLDKQEREKIGNEVRKIIGSYSIPAQITLDQLRRIKSILDETA